MADSKGNDDVIVFLFLMAIFWGGGWLMWHAFRPQLTTALMHVRAAEMAIGSIWVNDEDIVAVPMIRTTDDEGPLKARMGDDNARKIFFRTKFGTWREYVANTPATAVQNDHIRVMTYVALRPLRIPIALAFFGMFVWTIFRGPTSRLHRSLGLESLMIDQAKTFKVIRPFLKFNPNTLPVRAPGSPVPTDLGLFSEALEPEEWIALNRVRVLEGNAIDRATAEEAFAKQLGPRWKGWQALPNELQVLLAGFCLKASRKRNESDDLLGRLMCCWDPKGGMKLSRDRGLLREARKILNDKKLSEKTLGNCNRHAYVSTALMRALNTAREEGGVLAPSQFVWLRGENRALWYPLNNLGRQAYHSEALGICSHYRAEKQINRPIPRPRVGDAIDGLQEYLKNPIVARPIPPVEDNKKKSKKAA